MIRPTLLIVAKYLMVLLGCVHMTCGPQGALQVVAWASMLASYSFEYGVAKGVVDTFSGERPCAMCEMLAETKSDGDGSPDAPNPERRTAAPGMAQEWQAARNTRFDPPVGRALEGGGCRPPARLGGDSRVTCGPDAPPPRFV